MSLPPRLFAVGIGLSAAGAARAQGLQTFHPVVPSAGIAVENGPGAMWVNPANMAYDPDGRAGLLVSRGLDAPTSVAATVGAGGFGLGLQNRLRSSPLGVASDWALDYGTSVALPKRLAVGFMLSWRFQQDARNYVAYDAGASWRPLPWLGFGAVAQNVGDPDPTGLARPRSGGGIALRPAGSLAVIGADYARLGGSGFEAEDHLVGSLRVRPIEGLYLRGSVDSRFDRDGLQGTTFAAGVEVYLGGIGGGYVASTSADPDAGATQTLLVGTDEPGESLIRSGRRVPTLNLSSPPPYQPRGGLFGSNKASWLETLERLRRVEEDPGVRGLTLTLDGASLSLARARELRDRLVALQARDKLVLVYLTGAPANTDYYVASAAARVAMHPASDLQLTGLSAELVHLRGLLDLVGVEPQFVKRGDYKTSPEMFTEVEPTPANLEMTEALLDDLFTDLVGGIAAGRKVEQDVVRGWIDGGPHSADGALAAGIVDVLLYPDQLEAELEGLHGGEVASSDLDELPQPRSPWEDPQQIAIIYVDGGIVSGESSRGGLLTPRTAGSASIVKQLNRARSDPQVQAVVIRVDSPGGSAFASDEIWRATQRVEQKGKPVVVSMGSVAASGGYYVAAGADAIWAEPSTITGSIGVFSGKFSTHELQERLGVNTVPLTRGRVAGTDSFSRPWDDLQRARLQSLVDHTYDQFKARVVAGRDLEPDEVEAVARGRVWSGAAARERGLVDELGGFQDAIADARQRAGINANRKVGLVEFSDSGDLLQSLAPAIAAASGRVGGWLRAGAPGRTELEQLTELIGPLDPLMFPLLHPDERLWLLDPYVLRVGP